MSLFNSKSVNAIQDEQAVGNLDLQTQKKHEIWQYIYMIERTAYIYSNGNDGNG